MRILLVISLLPFLAFGQLIEYNPGLILERTLPSSHYDTDYIFIDNISNETLDLEFELIKDSTVSGWHTSVCTGALCFNSVPGSGSVGTIGPGEQGYFSINLSTNEKLGDGELRFLIFEKDHPEIHDTLRFIYHVEDAPQLSDEPWAKISFVQGVLTVILKSPQFETELVVYDLKGNRVVHVPVEAISSIRMIDYDEGIYIAVVKDETGRQLTKKVANFRF